MRTAWPAARQSSRMQSDAMWMQQMQAQMLGLVAPAAPAPQPEEAEEAVCVVCMDAFKQHVMGACMHMSACEACAQQLLEQGVQSEAAQRTALRTAGRWGEGMVRRCAADESDVARFS
jgi:hypothetical protein